LLGALQKNYEHSVPLIKDCESNRKVLVFRNGLVQSTKDNGTLTTTERVPAPKRIWFGHPPKSSGIAVGQTSLTRQELAETNVHE